MKHRAAVLPALVLAGCLLSADPARACTTIIVGRARTVDHSVLIAHNEDDEGAVVMHHVVHPSRPGGAYRLFNTGSVAEPQRTVAYMGTSVYDKAFIPGDYFGGVNAHQVAAYNNQAPGKLGTLRTRGGVMWTEFNELAMMQARTAREAVQAIGRLNETHGLNSDPGTAFGVADPREGWWIEIAPGGQWAAQRVPDDGAQMIANCYRIGAIDFADTRHERFLWSADVVGYARSMGWYDPKDGPFDFARAYGLASAPADPANAVRHVMVQRALDALPKVAAADLMSILRSHYEGSEHDAVAGHPAQSPHHAGVRTVCTSRTPASFVTQLRGWLPAPIGAVVWVSLCSPCSSVYVPWYGGVGGFPEPYTTGSDTVKDGSAWWAFDALTRAVDARYGDTNATVRAAFAALERRELAEQAKLDATATSLWRAHPDQATQEITRASGDYGLQAYRLAQSLRAQITPQAVVTPPAAADTGTVPAGPFSLRYRIEGTGRPAIVIGSSVYYPRVFSQNLRRHLRLVFLDHRGFVPSPGPVGTAAYALDTLLDDVERARQQLGLERVAVVGHSGHALLALEYAKKYPAHVSHVVMVGIAPDLSDAGWQAAERQWRESVSPERKTAMEENVRRLPDAELAKLSPAERFVKSYVRDGPRAWYDPRFDASPLWAGMAINVEMLEYVWGRVLRDIDITRGLAGLERPVFLGLGHHDFVVAPPSSWDRIRPLFRDLTLRVFERSGHTPPYEEPELFDAELLRWFEAHP